jgi:hypothetical protein
MLQTFYLPVFAVICRYSFMKFVTHNERCGLLNATISVSTLKLLKFWIIPPHFNGKEELAFYFVA